MLTVSAVPDTDPLLQTSPLIRGVLKMALFIEAQGGIGLTKSGAFNRRFVHWAAAEFDWPGYSNEALFTLNKVLDEIDFPPLGDIHALFLGLKLGRHVKNVFHLTRAGRHLVAHPGRLLSELVPNYLFRIDHGAHLRARSGLLGNWDLFLNVINVEADRGTSLAALRRTLYGQPAPVRFDEIASTLFITVVRPLCWAGLLSMDLAGFRHGEKIITKSPLWRRYLRLESDRHLERVPIH